MMHEMALITTYPSGAEDWLCSMCGRRFIVAWNPFNRIMLNVGDETAIHSGGKGGLRMGRVEVEEAVPDDMLSAWLDALQ